MRDLPVLFQAVRTGIAGRSIAELRDAVTRAVAASSGGRIEVETTIAHAVARDLGIATAAEIASLQGRPGVAYGESGQAELQTAVLEWCDGGKAFPHFESRRVTEIYVTPAGLRAARSDAEHPHPLSSAYGDGIVGLPEEAAARLDDAAACYRVRLLRPAIVMVGVAYEHVIELVADELKIHEGHHAARADKVRQRVQDFPAKGTEARAARCDALHALSVARVVAEQRNGAGHPRESDPRAIDAEDLVWKAPHWMRRLLAIPTLFT